MHMQGADTVGKCSIFKTCYSPFTQTLFCHGILGMYLCGVPAFISNISEFGDPVALATMAPAGILGKLYNRRVRQCLRRREVRTKPKSTFGGYITGTVDERPQSIAHPLFQ